MTQPEPAPAQATVSNLGRAQHPALLDIAWQTAYRLGFPVARIWWRLQRRRHVGALVAIHVGQSLLLLRSSYRSAWNFPGGSVRQGETPEVSVRRELAEEIGLVANAPLQLAGEARGMWDGRIDRVFLFVLRLDSLPTLQLDNREIIGSRLVPIDDVHKAPLTGPVQAYVRGQFHRLTAAAAGSISAD
jgi:8-oxo-dGTP pyrophosphatase MutT (NUDIX family)